MGGLTDGGGSIRIWNGVMYHFVGFTFQNGITGAVAAALFFCWPISIIDSSLEC